MNTGKINLTLNLKIVGAVSLITLIARGTSALATGTQQNSTAAKLPSPIVNMIAVLG